MTRKNGSRNGYQPTGAAYELELGSPEAGYGKWIENLTGLGPTVFRALSSSNLDPRELNHYISMWMRGIRQANSEPERFKLDNALKQSWDKADLAKLPYPIQWVVSRLAMKLSVDGFNARRQTMMHVGYISGEMAGIAGGARSGAIRKPPRELVEKEAS